jgi:Cobalamin-independent synthase, Catalytic domain
MNGSNDRILTTHVGSLPRPPDLLDMMKVRLSGGGYDETVYEARLRSAVAEMVRRQIDCGIDIVADGEMSKPGFSPMSASGFPDSSRGPVKAAKHSHANERPSRNTTTTISSAR